MFHECCDNQSCCVHGLGLDNDMYTRVDDAIVLRVYSAKCREREWKRENGQKMKRNNGKKATFFFQMKDDKNSCVSPTTGTNIIDQARGLHRTKPFDSHGEFKLQCISTKKTPVKLVFLVKWCFHKILFIKNEEKKRHLFFFSAFKQTSILRMKSIENRKKTVVIWLIVLNSQPLADNLMTHLLLSSRKECEKKHIPQEKKNGIACDDCVFVLFLSHT